MLESSGCIAAIDAMGCQKQIARTLTEIWDGYLNDRAGSVLAQSSGV